MADNLGWFEDEKINIENILAKKGEKTLKIDDQESVGKLLSKFIVK